YGYAVALGRADRLVAVGGGYIPPPCTNNVAEITALLVPLARLWKVARPGRVRLVSDSQYALNGFTRWLDSWAYRDWRTADGKPVANRRLWEQALFYTHRVRLSQEWVRGHQEAAPGRGPLHARA